MAKSIDLDKTELVEMNGNGLILEVTKDEHGQVFVRVESEIGGRRIIIKQHEEDARCIVFALEAPPPDGQKLTLVK